MVAAIFASDGCRRLYLALQHQRERNVTSRLGPTQIDHAASLLRAGELIAFPTETVYGLGADATNDRAVAAIFAAKGRPRFNPLIVHLPDLAAAEAVAEFGTRARDLARR